MNNQKEATIVTNWDSMPPEVYAEGEVYSTRVLAMKYKLMEKANEELKEDCERLKEKVRLFQKDLSDWNNEFLV